MDIEALRSVCMGLPGATEDIKWENDLCFLIGGKMFCVTALDSKPVMISLKVDGENYDELILKEGIVPAPYLARHKWVLIKDVNAIPPVQLMKMIRQSYKLIKAKLPGKKLNPEK